MLSKAIDALASSVNLSPHQFFTTTPHMNCPTGREYTASTWVYFTSLHSRKEVERIVGVYVEEVLKATKKQFREIIA